MRFPEGYEHYQVSLGFLRGNNVVEEPLQSDTQMTCQGSFAGISLSEVKTSDTWRPCMLCVHGYHVYYEIWDATIVGKSYCVNENTGTSRRDLL